LGSERELGCSAEEISATENPEIVETRMLRVFMKPRWAP
jgi:hypothetical protein